MTIIYWAIPFFLVSMVIEWRLTRGEPVLGYRAKDSAASISMGLGYMAVALVIKVVSFGFFLFLWEHRAFEIPSDVWWAWLLLIPAEDFCYYWYHRVGHEVRFFWASHINHHSSTSYNLSTALRQSWTSPLVGPIFWAPLALIGFHPLMVAVAQSISLVYQYWIHTELVDRLGPLEWVFNTPSHHRVHHGRNPRYLDRNYAGILIIWDRLFGTFELETERPDYGLTTNLESFNPVVIAFHEWRDLFLDVVRAKTWRGRLGYLICAPGWREDGTGKTAPMLREVALRELAMREVVPGSDPGRVAVPAAPEVGCADDDQRDSHRRGPALEEPHGHGQDRRDGEGRRLSSRADGCGQGGARPLREMV